MIAAKSGRVSAGPKRASDVTMPPAENPIMPTRSGRYAELAGPLAHQPHGLPAVVGRQLDHVLPRRAAGGPAPPWMSRYFRTKASTPIALSRRAMSTPS